MNLEITCEYANLETAYDKNKMKVTLTNCNEDFLGNIEIKDIISGYDNRGLFEALIVNDEDLLHDYLTKSGYVFSKA